MISFLMLAGGLILLLICGDMLVRGAVALSLKLNVPTLIVGLTVVSLGTSLPELFVSLNAVFAGHPEVSIGNVVGSNIANVLLVLGVPALVYPLACEQPGTRRNALTMLAATAVFMGLIATGKLSLWHGLVLVALLVAFLVHCGIAARAQGDVDGDDFFDDIEPDSLPRKYLLIAPLLIVGFVGLPLGADLLVSGAISVAGAFGLSDAVIGLTLIAIGTSLPELAATLVAALRRQAGIAIGNVIGSNIFNILAIMGVTAVTAPIPIPEEILIVDMWVMAAAAVLVVGVVLARKPINRVAGFGLVLAYGVYLAYLLVGSGSAQIVKADHGGSQYALAQPTD